MRLYIVLIVSLLCGCVASSDYLRYDGAMLGTTARVIAEIDLSSRGALHAIAQRVDRSMQSEMSIFDPSSQLSRVNRSECDSLTPAMIYNIRLADSVSRLSGGVYDITILPLVKARGFAGDEQQAEPNIDSLLEFVGYEKISILDGRLVKSDRRVQIDLNSIAKGYTVDLFAEELEQLGVENYLVDIGGELRCRGKNSRGEPWRIGIESPFDGNMSEGEFIEKRISMRGERGLCAMATSGNYRRYYLDNDGNKIAHTIDPRSGKSSISKLLSATVIARSCALADAYGTMFMAVGSDGAEQLAAKIENIEVYFIYSNESGGYSEYLSPGMKSLILE